MFELINISKQFKTDFYRPPIEVLKNINLKISEGSIIGFLGANGAGKTTTIKIMMNFIAPTSGEIKVSNTLGKDLLDAKRNLGYLPERPYFYPHLKGREFLEFMGRLSGVKRTELKSQIKRWTERLKIDYALDRMIRSYSKGMLQRIGMASTLLHEPQLIILDEPLSGLDPIGRKDIKDVVIDLKESGKTVFFSSHILPDVEQISDQLIFISDGEVVYNDSLSNLYSNNLTNKFEVVVPVFENHEAFLSDLSIELALRQDKLILSVEQELKDKLISQLVQQNLTLESVQRLVPSLEEVFYKVKQ